MKSSEEIVAEYISAISDKLKTGQAREHAYRPVFEKLILALDIQARPLNEPKHSEFGAPDFAFTHRDLILGYAETKDLGVPLDRVEKSEQMARYLVGYSNLILTDYLEFRFFKNGMKYGDPICIGTLSGGHIKPIPEAFNELVDALQDFLTSAPERIKSGKRLSEIMGGKARRIRDNVLRFLSEQEDSDLDLQRIYESVKKLLVHDLTPEHFADMYAQTLVYGLFVARYYDDSSETFSRMEARDLVPASNPFLRQFFDHIAGVNFNRRLVYVVDELCAVFLVSNIRELIDQYFDRNGAVQGQDPIIHFYEDFLKEYDPVLRKKMGAYYTPLPVVRFIVRAVDDILQKEFGLLDGLADTAKLSDGRHRVQVLDPAVGTGTFISAVIRRVYERLKERKQLGQWTTYVHRELLPRIHGFELMMAAYVIAHLKLSIEFKRSGFTMFFKRLGIYLTNSLEQVGSQNDLLSFGFSQSIAEEAKQAAAIKNETPIMVVIGNPPYSAASSNETEYANGLVEKYKVEPGGLQKLKERKHWLNDDYVKFIALAENFIDDNGEGVVGFITNHGYLDNPTFRGMRWRLMESFDIIYILDLHGNAKKREITPDGSKDENVFAIQQGVAIVLAIKHKREHKELAKIQHTGLWGTREKKFEQLDKSSIGDIEWTTLHPKTPNLLFVPNLSAHLEERYQKGFGFDDLFLESTTGIFTLGDSFIVSEDKETLRERIHDLLSADISESALKTKYDLGKNYAKWVIGNKKNITFDPRKIISITYRPFDSRYTYFDNQLVWRPRTKLMNNFLAGPNLGMTVGRQGQVTGSMQWNVISVTKEAVDLNYFYRGGEQVFPLYIYTDDGSRVPNFKKEVVANIKKIVGEIMPEHVFDYIYAVLHSPGYREKYKEFLKIDFPRVPYPTDKKQFLALVALGKELRELHLLESPKVNQLITTYPTDGSNVVEKPVYKDRNVFINKDQYFGNVPEVAWNFWIGGYQPAQKWLKDRKSRALTNTDIEHYQKMIVALTETQRVMYEIDKFFKA